MTFLQLRSVSKRYGKIVAVDNVDLDVPAGHRVAVVGPSGSGKTTLLRMIAGFETPEAGRIALDGELLADGAHSTPAHRRNIGIVAQDGALFPHLSIADNIGFGLPRNDPGRAARIADLMAMVGLETSMLRRRPDELSGGQQQRVALARALARKPRLMLLDEPFSALDTALRASTRKAVADLLQAAKVTTVLVTHDQAEALSFAQQVAVMRDGKLLQVGAPRDIYLRPDNAMIAEFLGEAIILDAHVASGRADCALGGIGVNDHNRRGAARIMLRPEQLVLSREIDVGENAPAGPMGKVLDINFAGAVCTVTVSLLNQAGIADGAPVTLLLRRSYIEAPSVGDVVRITIVGEAHVFTDPIS